MNENQNTEYKRLWKDEYLKWVSGFANAQGGKIYIGIDDDLTVVGVDNLHKQLQDIPLLIVVSIIIVAGQLNMSFVELPSISFF